ncbi:MAG TPA: hypothetical protein VK915_07310 [Gaiellaceae bacterium]|nr:hypothetical protein [Gaiellaceae bacterium]
MTSALLVAFAIGFLVVAVSLVAVVFARVRERALLASAVALGVLALAAVVVAGLEIARGSAEEELLLVSAGGLLVAALAQAALVVLSRALARARDVEAAGDRARARLDAALAAHAEERKAELERTLAKERANASYVLGEQERRLGEERRDMVARQAERARVELAGTVASAQERLESRLRAWAADLERGQRALETQVGQLAQQQREALAAYDARLEADTERLGAASEEQREALAQLRSEFERIVTGFVEEGQGEIEAHAAERRRALHEVSERLRARERSLREQIEREEADARARLATGLAEAERRQLSQLERALERAATRLSEDAERRFDAQIKESREKAAERLSRQLERSVEQFVRQAEKDVSDRIAELARTTSDRMERRTRDVTRAAEAQHEVASDRLRHVSERLEQALAAADDRIAALEAEIELRLGAKLDALERTLRDRRD